ncbi:MAG TPA: hypothetical protein VGF94_11005 [Kofleriaceae bacterium]
MTYDDALRALYQTPHDRFVAERKRRSDELRAAGDREAAAKIAKLARPSISAWVVNQLYWHARPELDELLATAARLRDGEVGAATAHRDVIAKLRQRAANLLADAGNAATETTMRRVTTNLSAIAAVGGFEPDPPGALAADRAAPGFEAAGVVPVVAMKANPEANAQGHSRAGAADASERAEEERRREQQRRADETARLRAERERVAAALRTATGELEAGQRRVRKLEQEIRDEENKLAKLRSTVDDLEQRLGADPGIGSSRPMIVVRPYRPSRGSTSMKSCSSGPHSFEGAM